MMHFRKLHPFFFIWKPETFEIFKLDKRLLLILYRVKKTLDPIFFTHHILENVFKVTNVFL